MLIRTLSLHYAAALAILLVASTATASAATVGPAEGMSAMFVANRAAELTASLDNLNTCIRPDSASKPNGWHEILRTWIETGGSDQPGRTLILQAAADASAGPAHSLADLPTIPAEGGAPSSRPGPTVNTAALTMAPGGFGRIQVGRPTGADDWSQAGQTSMSYVRPQVNVQMALSLLFPGSQDGNHFEGPGFDSRAQLSVGHRVRVDSAELGGSTESFGLRTAPPLSQNESQTALAVGMDAGILSTFLSQMGLSVQLVASHGQHSGDVIVALVGTTELPLDWRPREHPEAYPMGRGENPMAGAGATFQFSSQGVNAAGIRAAATTPGSSSPGGGGGGGGGGPPGPGPGPIPIVPLTPITPNPPVVPEPATLALMGIGLALAAARKARR